MMLASRFATRLNFGVSMAAYCAQFKEAAAADNQATRDLQVNLTRTTTGNLREVLDLTNDQVFELVQVSDPAKASKETDAASDALRKNINGQARSLSTTLRATPNFNAVNGISEFDVVRGRALGEGSFGTVYEGEYMGMPVALKTISCAKDQPKAAMEELRREAATLAKMQFDSVLRCYGACFTAKEPFMVVELVEQDLQQQAVKLRDLDKEPLIPLFADAAIGLTYIHRREIVFVTLEDLNCEGHGCFLLGVAETRAGSGVAVTRAPLNWSLKRDLRRHKDIKCNNIGVAGGRAKIMDFGLSRTAGSAGETYHVTTERKLGAFCWRAPELFEVCIRQTYPGVCADDQCEA